MKCSFTLCAAGFQLVYIDLKHGVFMHVQCSEKSKSLKEGLSAATVWIGVVVPTWKIQAFCLLSYNCERKKILEREISKKHTERGLYLRKYQTVLSEKNYRGILTASSSKLEGAKGIWKSERKISQEWLQSSLLEKLERWNHH